MNHEILLEKTIDQITKLSRGLVSLRAVYAERLPPVLEEEIVAIKAHNLRAVEKTGRIKNDLMQEIETLYSQALDAARSIIWLFKNNCDASFDISEGPIACLEAARRLIALVDEAHLAVKRDLLVFAVRQYETALDEFARACKQIRPQIERNKTIVGALLKNHQESNDFWRRMAQNDASSYDAKGIRSTQKVQSQLRVTA